MKRKCSLYKTTWQFKLMMFVGDVWRWKGSFHAVEVEVTLELSRFCCTCIHLSNSFRILHHLFNKYGIHFTRRTKFTVLYRVSNKYLIFYNIFIYNNQLTTYYVYHIPMKIAIIVFKFFERKYKLGICLSFNEKCAYFFQVSTELHYNVYVQTRCQIRIWVFLDENPNRGLNEIFHKVKQTRKMHCFIEKMICLFHNYQI